MNNRNIGPFEIRRDGDGVVFTRNGIKGQHSLRLPMDWYEFTIGLQKWIRREGLIQDIFPTLDADQREFIQTGITPSEWAEMFAPDEDTELNNPEVV